MGREVPPGAGEAGAATLTSDKKYARSRIRNRRGLDIPFERVGPSEAHQMSFSQSAGLSTPEGPRLRMCV
jgi:hypothetical protein